MANNRKPSLNRQNKQPKSLQKGKRKQAPVNSNNVINQILSILRMILIILIRGIYKLIRIVKAMVKKNPKMAGAILGIIILILILFAIFSQPSSDQPNNQTLAPSVLIGNNSLGTVYREGPYGNVDSNVKIAYILGVHPREQGAHRLMEQAFKEKANDLNYSYYLYKINVTSDATDYGQSRMNGQLLGQEFVVPDMIENNFTFSVDVHYSNGNWGVARFIYIPSENNTLANELGNAICDNFEWIVSYVPPNPTSPSYVTIPLNDGGVASIIYEAYTEDDNNVTLEHDRQMVDFIDNWNFTDESNEKSFFSF